MALIGVIGGLGAATFISFTNVLLALSYAHGATPATFLLVRYVLLVLLAGAWVARQRESLATTDGLGLHVLGVGLTNVIGATALSFAIQKIPVSLAVVLLYSFPMLTLLMDCVLDRHWPSVRALLCLLVAFIGLALAVQLKAGDSEVVGIALALLAALGIATSFVWTNRRLATMPSGPRLFHVAVVGLVFSIVVSSTLFEVVSPLGTPTMSISLLLASLAFCGAYVFMFAGIARSGASSTAMLMNLEPPLTVLIAFVVLGESLTPMQLLGIALVVVAVLTAQRGTR